MISWRVRLIAETNRPKYVGKIIFSHCLDIVSQSETRLNAVCKLRTTWGPPKRNQFCRSVGGLGGRSNTIPLYL